MRNTADKSTIDFIEETTGDAYKPVKGCGTVRGYKDGCTCNNCHKAQIGRMADKIVKAALRTRIKSSGPINQPKEQAWNF